jgi:hypothetical protein
LIERSGASTSAIAVTFCKVMSTSEAHQKAATTSPDRSGEAAGYAEAVERFAEINRSLAAIGEGVRVPRARRLGAWRDLMATVSNAKAAGLLTLETKAAQLQAAEGRPLTFCFGRICKVHELKQLVDAEVVWGDGCGVVFVDSVTSSRPIFVRYCTACGASKQRRRAAIIARLTATVWAERVPVAGGWRLTCTGCGERFFTPTPQRRRCDNCRH